MTTIRILDLYCGAGGAAVGYDRAARSLGLDCVITGIDIKPQPRYPFHFIQADALAFLAANGHDFDFIHASPECQGYSITQFLPNAKGRPRTIPEVRAALIKNGKPWVIENVARAPLDGITLCGLTFGLKVFRHRKFEASMLLFAPPHIDHGDRHIGKDGMCCVAGHGDAWPSIHHHIPKEYQSVKSWRSAMQIDWMTRDELAQAIPPAYTNFIGRQCFANL